MTVKDLIKSLQEMPQDALIVAEYDYADSVICEKHPYAEVYSVRIFKSWGFDWTNRYDLAEGNSE